MKPLFKQISIAALWVLISLVILEAVLQLGALIIKENAWRAKTHWLTGNVRVLALGDSNTYGLYLPAEDSYPSQLEKQWNTAHPEMPIEIINLGYPGTNSFRLLANLPDILDTFKPDLVLLMIGFNDFWTPVEPSPNTPQLSWTKKILYHSRIYKLVLMVFQQQKLDREIDTGDRMLGGFSGINLSAAEIKFLEARTGLSFIDIQSKKTDLEKDAVMKKKLEEAIQQIIEERKKNASPKDILNTVKYGDKTFSLGIADGSSAGNSKQMEKNIISMLALLNERNINYFLINYPSNHGYYPAANRKIHSVAEQTHSRYIDLGNTFSQECRNKPESCPDQFFYDGHATANGNHRVSTTVMQNLEGYFDLPEK